MNRIPQNIRGVARTATHYPAKIVDVHGDRASARLSGNGAIIHNISVVGGPVDIGDSVTVDFSTPDPYIITTSKEWLTMDDLNRELAKLAKPQEITSVDEINKWIVLTLDDLSSILVCGQVNWRGWYEAIYYEVWERWINDQGFPDVTVRWPPGILSDPSDEQMYELYDGGTVASHVGDAKHPTLFNFAWATQAQGNRFENINFRAVATYDWLTGYNFYFWNYETTDLEWHRNLTSGSYAPGNFDCVFRNCEFFSEVYPDPYSLQEYEYNNGIPYSNIWIDPSYDSGEFIYRFYNCKFHARPNPEASVDPHAIYLEGATLSEDVTVYLHNCYIDCGPRPFSNELWSTMDEGYGGNYGHLNVYSYNCQFVDYNGNPIDPSTIECLTVMDDGDRSPANHIHTSGSSGAYDQYAIHTNVAGEW